MSISSQQIWPHIRDAFGISPELQVTDFQLNLKRDGVAEISMTMFADYNPETGSLNTISTTFKLGDAGVPKEQADNLYWSGVRDGYHSGKDPVWMHAAHLMAFDAKQELQQMTDNFKRNLNL